MGQFVFGAGNVIASNPASATFTPQQLGTVQDISVGFDFTNVPLLGQYQYPVAVGRGAGKVEGSAKFASFGANMFMQVYFNVTPTVGQTLAAVNETHTVSGAAVTVVPPSSGVFLDDGGVVYSATGIEFQRVASAPAVGQYSVNLGTGVYTFNATDNTQVVLITYTYTVSSSGYSAILANQLMGQSVIFKLTMNNAFNNLNLTLELYQATSTKLTLGFKNTNWSVPDFAYSCFTNAANNLGKLSLAVL